MRSRKRIFPFVSWVCAALLGATDRTHASEPTGLRWDHIPALSLNLNVADPVDAAGLIDPWNAEASIAALEWGGVPGAEFQFSWDFSDHDWCDHATPDRNAVEWGIQNGPTSGVLTPCSPPVTVLDALAITIVTELNGCASSSDTLFDFDNLHGDWTTDARLTTGAPIAFRSVALHEFGHVLGLGDEDDTLAVMNSLYHPSRHLHADDRHGLRSLYGVTGTETDLGPSIWKKPDSRRIAAEWTDFPRSAVAGQTIRMEWTQENFGTTDVTFNSGFYLSTDPSIIPQVDTLLDEVIAGSLLAGTSNTQSIRLAIPTNTPPQSYFLGVCLDHDGAVAESKEFNNCVAYPEAIEVAAPSDLVVSALGMPPAWVDVGGQFDMLESTANIGAGPASGAYSTGYRMRSTTNPNAPAVDVGHRDLPPLNATESSTRMVTAHLPAAVGPGTYSLEACADRSNAIFESEEANNCRTSGTFEVAYLPDLSINTVSDPPASASVGSSFSVTDTTVNFGLVASAPESTTRYRLSADATITSTDSALTGVRVVPPLAAFGTSGDSSLDTVTVSIPTGIQPGAYYLGACADDLQAVPESDETRNCRASSTTVDVTKANLQVASVNNPPASISVGTAFSIKDRTQNVGSASAPASTNCYRLSEDAVITAPPALGPVDLPVGGSRAVPALAAGAGSTGAGTVTIPATVPSGIYYLGVCADDGGSVVAESSESDNCRAAATTVQVNNPQRFPDLVIEAVTGPAGGGVAGMSISVTDTVANVGTASSAASTTSYWLSTDETITFADARLNGIRAVPALAAGTRLTGPPVVAVLPSTVAPGNYYLGACADDGAAVVELREMNNCRAIPFQIAH